MDRRRLFLASVLFFCLRTGSQAGILDWGTFAPGGAETVSSLTVSNLTSGRVPFATTGGLLTDASGLSYATTSGLAVTGSAAGPKISWGDGTRTGYLYGDTTVVGVGSFSNHPLIMFTNYGASFVFLSTSSRVGIGTGFTSSAAPAALLDVAGTAKLGAAVTDTITLTGLPALPSDSAPRTNITPTVAGQLIYNSADKEVCFSTGTAATTWVQIRSASTACTH